MSALGESCRKMFAGVTRGDLRVRRQAMSLYAQYAALLDGVLDELVAEGALPAGIERKNVTVEPPRDAAHGDLATNAAMVLAKGAGTNPRALAEAIRPKLESAAADSDGSGGCRAGLHQPSPAAGRLARRASHDPYPGDRYGLVRRRRERAGQCRICLGQSNGPLHMAIVAARLSATALPACSKRRAFG